MLKKGSAAYFMRNFTHGITNIWEELYKNIFAFPETKTEENESKLNGWRLKEGACKKKYITDSALS